MEEDPDRDKGQWPDVVLIDGGKGQMSAVKAALEELGVEDVNLVAIAKGPHHGREGARFSTFPMGARRCCRSIHPCCSSCSGCATKCTALPSAPTAKTQPRHHRQSAGRDPRHRPGAQAGAAAAFRHRKPGARRRAGGSDARAGRFRGRGAQRV
jgi:hypothetical protein